ncbi:MAG: hypothetical protein AAF657_25330 [Acidobacteriota bacterium]
MEKQSSLFAVLVAIIAVIAVGVIFKPVVDEQLAPELVGAWVAIQPEGSGLAEVRPFDLEAGAKFRLHAVLEARDRNGESVYYTQATRLSLDGEEVPAARLTVWDRPRPVKIRWFTVEGPRPFVTLEPEGGIEQFKPQELLRSDWPLSWSVPGEIDAVHDNHLANVSAERIQRFGTQRYHVRFELYADDKALIPERVIRSWGVDDLKAQIDRFPTVRQTLPGAARPASRVFGLTQLEPPPDASRELLEQIAELARNDLAFSLLTVIGDQIRQSGSSLGDLAWDTIDLAGDARWGEGVGPGDLLRVGNRIVVLYEDRGVPGVVDYPDLCFDYVQGAAVRALSDVFVGSGNAVEHASLVASPSS